MTPQEHEELDEDVWIALGCGDMWFPWDAPAMPHETWNPVETRPDAFRLEKYPPVSQDWNLAMWALARCMAMPDRNGHIRDVTSLFSLICENDRWSAAISGHFAAPASGAFAGPAAVCRAILKYRGCV